MRLTIAWLSCLIALGSAGVPAAAQSFRYNSRWYAGVRENVLTLQERHRARMEALEARRVQRIEAASAPTVSGEAKAALPAATKPIDR